MDPRIVAYVAAATVAYVSAVEIWHQLVHFYHLLGPLGHGIMKIFGG